MTNQATITSEFGRSIFERVSNAIDAVEDDLSTAVRSAIAGNVDGLQGIFDAALEMKASVGKEAGRAVAAKFNLIMRRAYFHASKAGFALRMPRLDGKGEITVPTLVPKEQDKEEKTAARAEANERNERALQEHQTRLQQRQQQRLAKMTASDAYLATVTMLGGTKVTTLELVQRLAIGLDNKDAKTLRDFLTKDVLSTPRKRSAKVAKNAPKVA